MEKIIEMCKIQPGCDYKERVYITVSTGRWARQRDNDLNYHIRQNSKVLGIYL